MLQKEYRLKKSSAFNATYRSGKTLQADGIILFCGKEQNRDIPVKIGFVVSKKVHKRAVKRNRIKRLMRESCRLLIKDNKIPNKYISLIFSASSRLVDKNFEQINSSVKKLAEKL